MRRLTWYACLIAALAAATPGWAQPLTGGLLGRSSGTYSTLPAPTGCVSTSVPFFGSDLKLTCGVFTDNPATGTISAPTVAARNVVVTALGTSTITSPLVVNGKPGETTYGYKRVDYLADGTSTAASAEVTIATGNATLDGTKSITVSWPALTGSVSTRLYRTTGGAAPPKLIYTGTATSYVDIGAAGTSQVPSATNTTGQVLAYGALVFGTGTDAQKPSLRQYVATSPALSLVRPDGVYSSLLLAGSNFVSDGAVGWSSSSTDPASSDLFLTRPAAATLQLGAAAANADGVDQRLQTQGGITGTDRAAGDLDLTTGLGTGTGYSKVTISAPTRVGTGTTAQTRAVRVTVSDIGVQWATGTRPTCDAAARGTTWYVAGGAGVADTFEVCGKAAADTYSWVALATF